jgi:hypothetical protein
MRWIPKNDGGRIMTLGRMLAVLWGFAVVWPCRGGADPDVRVVPTPHGGVAPDAELGRDGTLHLVYAAGNDVWYVKSTDEGKTFSEPLRVNAGAGTARAAGGCRGPDLAVGQGGRVHVVWASLPEEEGAPADAGGLAYSYLDPNAGAFTPARTHVSGVSGNYAVSADERGQVAVFWAADKASVHLSADRGETFGDPLPFSQSAPCVGCGARLLYTPDGVLYIIYRDFVGGKSADTILVFLRHETRHLAWGANLSRGQWERPICPQTDCSLTLAPGRSLLAAWETDGRVYYARLKAVVGRGLLEEPKAPPAVGQGRYPVALGARDGTVLVAWKHETDLRWQAFDDWDQPEGAPGAAPGTTPHRPAGVVTPKGRFLLFP